MDPEKPWLLAASYWLLPKFGQTLLCSLRGGHLGWLVSACSPNEPSLASAFASCHSQPSLREVCWTGTFNLTHRPVYGGEGVCLVFASVHFS